MKTIIKTIIIALTLVVAKGNAQDFQGVATYKSHRKVDLKIGNEGMNDEMQKQIQEQLKKQFQQEYTLTFNKNESIYKKNEKLNAPSPSQSNIILQIPGGSDVMYKNVKDNRYAKKTESFGKLFLIKDTLINRTWELVNETKNIGNYTCFKAVFKDDYKTQTFNEKGEMEEITKERTTTVWYTPQIPVNNGPADFHGLPGLILEVNDGELTLVCSKIVLNTKEALKIEEPTKGKEVTQAKYEVVMEKKNKEMMEQFHSKRGGHEGEIMIRVGG